MQHDCVMMESGGGRLKGSTKGGRNCFWCWQCTRMGTGKLKRDTCMCFLMANGNSSHAQCYLGGLIYRACKLLQCKQHIKMSGLELALRESDGRPITRIPYNRVNQTLNTIPWGLSPAPAQGKEEMMKSQEIFSISTFQTRTMIHKHKFAFFSHLRAV